MDRRIFTAVTLFFISTFPIVAGADTVVEPERTQGLVAPVPQAAHTLVNLQGPGKFVSAQITKQGGANDMTFVSLDIDGKNVVNASIAAIRNWGLTQDNPYGIVLVTSAAGLKTVTIGYPSTLTYHKNLKLSVTVQEAGVAQIIGNVVHGK